MVGQLFDPAAIRRILERYRVVAVVGLSPKPQRPSHMVARALLEHGYEVIPVNPGQTEILGLPCYPNLTAIGRPVEIVDVFRRADQVGPVVEEAIAIGAKALWLQQGIVNEEAAARARAAGLEVVMDRCMKVELERLARQAGPPL